MFFFCYIISKTEFSKLINLLQGHLITQFLKIQQLVKHFLEPGNFHFELILTLLRILLVI